MKRNQGNFASKRSPRDGGQTIINLVLTILLVICIVPIIYILALSFSSSTAISTGQVSLIPRMLTLAAYEYSLGKPEFLHSLWVSIQRVLLGCSISLVFTVLAAFPLSRGKDRFPMGTFYSWLFIITMLFSGGLVPTYMIILKLKMIDTIWALVIPGAVTAYNLLLTLNFFRSVPKEIDEAAEVDGAGYWRLLFSIYIPLSKTVIATTTLFNFVTHWNSWFDGLMYMNSSANYPLQTYLQSLVVDTTTNLVYAGSLKNADLLNDKNIKAAQIVLAAIPIVLVYPWLQKYFTKGMMIGSIKG